MSDAAIHYVEGDDALRQRIASEWGDVAARHMHLSNSCTIVAVAGNQPIGLIAAHWRRLPDPLREVDEGYIDIIEVREAFRRQGLASRLIALALERARERGAYQLRAWSSTDKTEALAMWNALQFGLCPATTYPQGQAVSGFFVTRVL